jgi:hypothetical protein
MKSQHSSLSKMIHRLHGAYKIHGRVGTQGMTEFFSNWHCHPLFLAFNHVRARELKLFQLFFFLGAPTNG